LPNFSIGEKFFLASVNTAGNRGSEFTKAWPHYKAINN